ncbi:MAG: hypothetical protein WC873_03260 [Candidatus Gracilibacteria bacterium]
MKKTLLTLIVILVIAAAILIGFKACNKTPTPSDTPATTEESSDSSSTIETPSDSSTDTATLPATDDSFRTAFVQASIELSCFLDKNPAIQNDQVQLRTQVYNYYQKYKLPVDDDAKMLEILRLYADDTTVIAEIKKGNAECK